LRANSSATGDLQADQRLQHRDACALEVHVGRRFRQALFRALLRGLRAREIDLVGLLGYLRENGDAIGLDFCAAKRDQEIVLLLPLPVPQRAHLKRRQQRRVTRQDAEIPVGARNLHLVDLLPHEQTLGRDDFELKMRWNRGNRHQPFRFRAFSTTSSIPPARKKSCSLMSSCLPSTISLKPRIVSAIGTYFPSRPVNCWATKNGWDRNR